MSLKIKGFQKMTVLDFPGRVACIVFTGGCNFRCPFCHNAALVLENGDEEYSREEVFDYLKKRKGLLDGVSITGGEPLLNPDIAEFIAQIKELGYLVKLDTNGTYYDRLKFLIDNSLVDYVAMDIKNSKDKYALTVGLPSVELLNIEKSIELLLSAQVDYEFRTTIVEDYHETQDIEAIANWIKGAEHYYLQSFVDSGNVLKDGCSAVSDKKLREMLNIAQKFIPSAEIRGK